MLCMTISLIQMKLIVLFWPLTEGYLLPYLQLEKDIVLLLLLTCFTMVAENSSKEDWMVKSIGWNLRANLDVYLLPHMEQAIQMDALFPSEQVMPLLKLHMRQQNVMMY